jgi:hypothetical protein
MYADLQLVVSLSLSASCWSANLYNQQLHPEYYLIVIIIVFHLMSEVEHNLQETA